MMIDVVEPDPVPQRPRRQHRPLLIALALAVTAAAGLALLALTGDGGNDPAAVVEVDDVPDAPLFSGGSRITMGMRLQPGQDKVTFGALAVDNTTDDPIELVSVQVGSVQEGTTVLGVRVNEFDSNGIGIMPGWTDATGVAPEGYQIPPGGYVEVVIGLQGSAPGGADEITIVYRSGGTTYSTTYDYHYKLSDLNT